MSNNTPKTTIRITKPQNFYPAPDDKDVKKEAASIFGNQSICKSRNNRHTSNGLLEGDYDELALMRREIGMWRAVITQALLDCASMSKRTEDQVAKHSAMSWFAMQNPDFVKVCEYAYLEPEYVMRKAKNAISNGCKWRNDVMKIRRQEKEDSAQKLENVVSISHLFTKVV